MAIGPPGEDMGGAMIVIARLAADPVPEVKASLNRGTALYWAFVRMPNRAWSVLETLAGDADPCVRVLVANGYALKEALSQKPAEAWSMLLTLAGDVDPSVRSAAAEGFALKEVIKKRPDESFRLVAELLLDTDEEVRLVVPQTTRLWAASGQLLLDAIVTMPKTGLPLLSQLVTDRDEDVRAAAAGEPLAAAIRLRLSEWLPVLETLLRDDWAKVRDAAAGSPFFEAVQRLPFEDAQALVQLAINDSSEDVIRSAGRAAAYVAKEALNKAVTAQANAELQTNLTKDALAEAEEAKANAELQTNLTKDALFEAEEAKAKAEEALKSVHKWQLILLLWIVFTACCVVAAWNGQRLVKTYLENRKSRRLQARVDAANKSDVTHKFFFVDANKIRSWRGAYYIAPYHDTYQIPHHQELMSKGWLKEKLWDLGEAMRGMYKKEYLVVSHRWYSPQDPDPRGEKVKALQKYLDENPAIQWVWLDFWSLPQWLPTKPRTDDEEVCFRLGLANIFMLFISCDVLVLFDLQYVGRFWTSYELWLSLRTITADGLKSTPADAVRAHILCMGAARAAEDIHIHSMHETWSDKSPQQAAEVLVKEDIVVTNQRDKDQQLKVLYELAARAAILYASAMDTLGHGQVRGAAGPAEPEVIELRDRLG